jgi:hypothetical protein
VTPVGDIEIEIVFRIAVRGRTSDLAMLLEAMSKAEAVVISIVEERTASEEQCQQGVTTGVGGFSG